MEITITWTKIIVVVAVYFTGRYFYYSYMKWVTGSLYPFDPTEYYKTSSYTHGWDMGYIHGSHKMKIRYEKCHRQHTELKEKYRIAHAKVAALEDSLHD
jgi:hypothetical protein